MIKERREKESKEYVILQRDQNEKEKREMRSVIGAKGKKTLILTPFICYYFFL